MKKADTTKKPKTVFLWEADPVSPDFLIFPEKLEIQVSCKISSLLTLTFPPIVQEFSFSSHPLYHLLYVKFSMMAFLPGMRWYLIIVGLGLFVFCISPIVNDSEHFFMCLLAIYSFHFYHIVEEDDMDFLNWIPFADF